MNIIPVELHNAMFVLATANHHAAFDEGLRG